MPASTLDKNTLEKERNRLHVMLLSSVSHDLKTPLACIIGALEIHEQLKDTLTIDHKNVLIRTALEEARRLDGFISNIIDMSKLESGIGFERERMDMGQFLRECILRSEPRLRQHDVQLELPFHIMAEVSATWICRAVTSLLDNAVRYTPAGTKIIVTLSNNALICQISVRDYGEGLSRKAKASIFHKHTRAERLDSRIAGTGLGLPICQAIAQAHGGTMEVDSPPDGGTVFTLTLPVTLSPKPKRDSVTEPL